MPFMCTYLARVGIGVCILEAEHSLSLVAPLISGIEHSG